ncbi:MAG: 50S ribosomal protein L6 [Pseudomonadota bacterium]
MSRIGKYPVPVPAGVTVQISGQDIAVKGPKGEMNRRLNDNVVATQENDTIVVKPRSESRLARALWATSRTVVNNMVTGVSKGFTKSLEIKGVGYRAALQGQTLVLQLGYSHEIRYDLPKGVAVAVEKQTEVSVTGIDKELVGQVAAEIRSYRSPEPYKGKGVRYVGEYIAIKEGKKK